MTSKETFRKRLDEITPSQLYLSSEKLKTIQKNETDLEPLPVKHISDKVILLDGHHRAFSLYKRGVKTIEVYEDDDDLDWLEYLVCVDWCEDEGIRSIEDLENRIVKEEDFDKLWLDRCSKMHDKVDDDLFQFVEFREEKDPELKSKICEDILHSLPDHFGIESTNKVYIHNVKNKYFVSVWVGRTVIGFTAVKEHNEFTSEIYVIGILEEFQGRGIGKKLIEKAEDNLREKGKKYLTVKTLGPSHPDEGYEKTRSFYRSAGFVPLEEFITLWDENNPCLYMVKSID
ncbi:MAG: GNAT family N-acetyltransferase [Candidatus Saliniplasma sp.]